MEISKLTEYANRYEHASFHYQEALEEYRNYKKLVRRSKWEVHHTAQDWNNLQISPATMIEKVRLWARKTKFFQLKVDYYTLKVRS